MARRAGDFLDALDLAQVDLVGFSMGGFVAQSVALQFPERVRKLVLVGTGPRGGVPSQDPEMPVHARLARDMFRSIDAQYLGFQENPFVLDPRQRCDGGMTTGAKTQQESTLRDRKSVV